MLRRKHKAISFKKTISIKTNETENNPLDESISLSMLTNKFLIDAQQDLNLSKICLTQKKITQNSGNLTTRTYRDHHQEAKELIKKFQRTNEDDDPFLKAKLRHMMKKEAKIPQQKSIFMGEPQQCSFYGSKYITLRKKNMQNLKKQALNFCEYRDSSILY